jgi:hypothetical protein
MTHYKDSFNKPYLLFTILVGSNVMFFFRIGDVVEVAFIHKKL